MLRTVLLIAGIGSAHFGLNVLAWFGAGVTGPYTLWRTASIVLGFPLSLLPGLDDHPLIAGLWVLQSLLWAGAVVALAQLVGVLFGHGRQVHLVWAAPLILVAATALVHAMRTPAPFAEWHSMWFDVHSVALPWVFTRAAAEEQAADAIAGQTGQPVDDRPRVQRWYWNYRPDLSGAPTYDGVAVVMDGRVDAETWLATLTVQRAQLWTQWTWEPVRTGPGWVLETVLPDAAPLPRHERLRLLRIRSLAPREGRWFGMVVLARRATADDLVVAWQRAHSPPPTVAGAEPSF